MNAKTKLFYERLTPIKPSIVYLNDFSTRKKNEVTSDSEKNKLALGSELKKER